MREALAAMLMTLMNAKVDCICGAEAGERRADRLNSRNGYRQRTLDTRVGTIELAIPKLRQGSYFPAWPRESRRVERALTVVISKAYLFGFSIRRGEGLVQRLGIERISKSQVSELAKNSNYRQTFRERPLIGSFRYVLARRPGAQVP